MNAGWKGLRAGGAVLVAAIVLGACGSPEVGGSAVDDLAVATFTAPVRIDGLERDLVPIGWFSPTSSVAVAPDGSVAFTQEQDGQVRVLAPDGSERVRVGRSGDGPGEFRRLLWIGWRDGRLHVVDPMTSRVTSFSAEGELVDTRPLPRRPVRPAGSPLPELLSAYAFGLASNADVLARVFPVTDLRFPDSLRHRAILARLAADGAVVRDLGRLWSGDQQIDLADGSAVALPFPIRNQVGVSPDGTRIATAQVRAADLPSARFQLRVVDDEGVERFAGAYPFDPIPIPAAVADSVVEARAERMPIPALADAIRSDPRIPPAYPPLLDLVVGADGSVWVARLAEAGGDRDYLVVDSAGRSVGVATPPGGARLAWAGRDRVWVIERDELGVESLVGYDLEWR